MKLSISSLRYLIYQPYSFRGLTTSASLLAKSSSYDDPKKAALSKAIKNWDIAYEKYKNKEVSNDFMVDVTYATVSQVRDAQDHINKKGFRGGKGWSKDTPIDLYSVNEGFMSLPQNVKVEYIDTTDALEKLEPIAKGDGGKKKLLYIDVDSTIYIYKEPNRATLLKFILDNVIYLIDLEKLRSKETLPVLTSSMNAIFQNNSYVKIAHHFEKKADKLQETCKKFSSSNDIICINDIIKELFRRTFLMDKSLAKILGKGEEKEKEIEDKLIFEIEGTGPRVSMESFCEVLLDKKMERTESLSVWNRRPLRSAQLRHSAIKAHALVQLIDVCEKWAQELNTDLKEVLQEQLSLLQEGTKKHAEHLQKEKNQPNKKYR